MSRWHGRPGRRARAVAVEPRQGALSGDRHHQGRGDRLLRPHRAGDGAAPRRSCITLKRFPDGVEQDGLLREALPEAPARVGPHGARARRPQRRHRLLPVRRAGRAGVGGQHGRARAARADGRVADDLDDTAGAGLRLRPRRAGSASRSAARSPCGSARCSPRSSLDGWCKTSGSKGLQMYVPLNTPCTHEHAADFALAVGQVLERQHRRSGDDDDGQGRAAREDLRRLEPERPVTRRRSASTRCAPDRSRRCRRRSRGTRSRPAPAGDVPAAASRATDVLERVERLGDLFEPVLTTKQSLPARCIAKLGWALER